MMPCGDLYPSMNYGMPHQQLKMLVPVMLLGAGYKSPARELQGASSQFTKIRLFSQRLVRAYISFDKASEQPIPYSMTLATVTGERWPGSSSGVSDSPM